MRPYLCKGLPILVAILLGALSVVPCFAQGGGNYASGGNRLVVSRAFDPAPVTSKVSVYQPISTDYWSVIALANARLALSFAPARGTYVSRHGAVSRRAIR
jgi:hypothetical protein